MEIRKKLSATIRLSLATSSNNLLLAGMLKQQQAFLDLVSNGQAERCVQACKKNLKNQVKKIEICSGPCWIQTEVHLRHGISRPR